MSPYISSVPFYVCQATYGQCVNAHPDDAAGQRICKQNAKCGTQNASATDTKMSSHKTGSTGTLSMATSTGSSGSRGSSGSSGSSGSKGSAASGVAAESKTKNAAAEDGVVGYSTSLFASAMFLAMRLIL